MERVVSGVRPTGQVHLGNYLGAISHFVRMQYQYDTFFFIADYHSLTTHPKAAQLKEYSRNMVVTYLACGLDPNHTTLYLQSDVPQIAELYLVLNMLAHLGELERSTTYKEKVERQQDNINAGLLTYPVLMAADILIHHAVKVPVGDDQRQHLEMTRTFANRFNFLYGTEYFKEPKAFTQSEELIRVPGLDGTGKMGKSEGEGNAIFLEDSPEVLRKKVMRAVTDTGPTSPNEEMTLPVKNLFRLLEIVSHTEVYQSFLSSYNSCTIRYGDLKGQLAVDIEKIVKPLRERIKELESDPKLVDQIMGDGGNKARKSAEKTIREVREIIGLYPVTK